MKVEWLPHSLLNTSCSVPWGVSHKPERVPRAGQLSEKLQFPKSRPWSLTYSFIRFIWFHYTLLLPPCEIKRSAKSHRKEDTAPSVLALESKPRNQIPALPLVPVWPQAKDFTSPYLSFCMCKMEIIIILPLRAVVGIKWNDSYKAWRTMPGPQ